MSLSGVVFSPRYDFRFLGLEQIIPVFDGRRSSGAWHLARQKLGDELDRLTVSVDQEISDEALLLVHTPPYLELTRDGTYVARVLEWPIPRPVAHALSPVFRRSVVTPMRWATAGTVIAAELALQGGVFVNLSGGFHHASSTRGEGFCLFSDVAVAIRCLRQHGLLEPTDEVLIVDLDAHQGNGLDRVFYDDPSIYFLDIFNRDIYPCDRWAQQRVNQQFPLSSGCATDEYLAVVTSELATLASRMHTATLAFYIAGTDVYEQDPLGRLQVSADGIVERDRVVLRMLSEELGVGCVVVPGGGYTRESRSIIAQSIYHLCNDGPQDTVGPAPQSNVI